MSSSDIRALRLELEALRVQVASQAERIAALKEGGVSVAPRCQAPSSQSSSQDLTVGSFSLVSGPASTSGIVDPEDHEARAQLAKEIGQFLRRALDGDFRGSSGRDRLRLASRIYIVLADFEGRSFNPPKVLKSFAEAKALCKRGSALGNSVFVGFAAQWEAKIAVKEAGLRWPVSEEQ